MTRMNLNTFARHGVFEEAGLTELIATRLRDAAAIARARRFPYQLLAAYRAADAAVPGRVRDALEDAMELAIANVPAIDGQVYRLPRRLRLDAVAGHRAAQGRDDGGALRRRGGARGRGDPPAGTRRRRCSRSSRTSWTCACRRGTR